VQIDGSSQAWLEARGPRLTLLAAIDDATGRLEAAVFRPPEDTQGSYLLLWQLVEQQGRPLALSHDRHRIFRPLAPAAGTQEERAAELAGPPRVKVLPKRWTGCGALEAKESKGVVE
jgi:hypothetical protein